MKLRIRSASSGGGGAATLRLEVPAACTLDGLYAVIIAALEAAGTRFTPPIAVTLNKTDALQGPGSAPIAQFGIRSGDLLFYLENVQASSIPATDSRILSGSASDARVLSDVSASATDSVIASVSASKCVTDEVSKCEASNCVTDEPSSECVTDACIRRQLCALAAAGRMASPPAAVACLATNLAGNSEHASSSSARHMSMDTEEEEEELGADDGQGVRSGSGAHDHDQQHGDGMLVDTLDASPVPILNSIPAILQRVLIAERENVRSFPDLLLLSVHAVMLETGFKLLSANARGYTLPADWSSSCVTVNLFYTPQDVGSASGNVADANLKAQKLGNNLVLYGTITLGTPKLVCRLSMSSSTYFRGHSLSNNTDHISLFSDLFVLWKCVKDELSLPLLTAICERAGLPVPSSLLVIPMELKMKILEHLSAPDLAKVGCTCSELKHLSANDEIWKRLFLDEFGSSSTGQQLQGFRGWKGAYEQRVLERRRALQRRAYPRRARYGISARFAPRFPPMGGIIGGDHDLYPTFGSGLFGGGLPGSRVSLGALHRRLRNDGMDLDEMPLAPFHGTGECFD